MKKIQSIITLIMVILFMGCASTPVTVLYIPSSIVTGEGEIKVNTFRYIPAEEGKVKPNQIKNTALTPVLISDNIDKYVTNAIRAEFKNAGYSIGRRELILSGDILQFLADDLGYSVDWVLSIHYKFNKTNSDQLLYEKLVKTELKSEKGPTAVNALNKTIKLSFEELVNDPKVQRLFIQT